MNIATRPTRHFPIVLQFLLIESIQLSEPLGAWYLDFFEGRAMTMQWGQLVCFLGC